MSVKRERKLGLLLIGSIVAIILLFGALSSCSSIDNPCKVKIKKVKHDIRTRQSVIIKPYYLRARK